MALPTQPYKGARDFYPEDKRLQKFIFGKLRQTVEAFGYEEYDAPILEPTDLYLSKGNQEIIDEQTYTFKDRGDRSVTIRTEMTPTVSRMVAGRRQELAYPLRWYSIPNLWRYERPQRGRLREFWQLNVDIFGVDNMNAELEVIQIMDACLKAFHAKHDMYTIRINSREFMSYVMHWYLEFDEVQAASAVRLIDRMHKMDRADFITQIDGVCTPTQREEGVVEKLLDVLDAKRISDLPQLVREHSSLAKLQTLLDSLTGVGITNAVFDITLMRGFDYYTDIVFEVFDTHPENNRSMFGGGRYDGMVAMFGVEPVPTVGFGMGDATLQNFLELHNLLPQLKPETDAYVVLVGDVYDKAQRVLKELRQDGGMRLSVDISGRKMDKQFKTAEKKGIHYVIIIGDDELEKQQYTLRNIQTGVEEKHGISRLVSIIEDYRNPSALHDRD
ncbi:MAG: histidine--tRNA ligase [Candidatus Saccharimonadales bacterium]